MIFFFISGGTMCVMEQKKKATVKCKEAIDMKVILRLTRSSSLSSYRCFLSFGAAARFALVAHRNHMQYK